MKTFCAFLGLLLAIPAVIHADYNVRSVSPIISADEQLIDAAPNGWLLLQDNTDPHHCPIRAKIGAAYVTRLCDKKLKSAFRINRNGFVLGKTRDRQLAIWGEGVGTKVLASPTENFDELRAMGLNDANEAVGYSTLYSRYDEATDSYTQEVYQAYRWTKSGAVRKIIIRGGRYSTQALGINNKGDIVVYMYRNFPEFYLGRNRFRRIDRRGQSVYALGYEPVSINERGQIAVSTGRVYTPATGWREIPGVELCDRCDFGSDADISESGVALFSYNNRYALAEYPHSVTAVTCLAPQNRPIENSNLRIQDIERFTESARLLDDGAVIFNANAERDGKSLQLFVAERRKNDADSLHDYCPVIEKVIDAASEDSCYYADTSDRFCSGHLTVRSSDGPLNGIAVSIYAQQVPGYDQSYCPPQLIESFQSNAKGNSFAIDIDPGFDYYAIVTDPKFRGGDNERYTIRSGSYIASPIAPCRKPFEGLIQ